MDLSYSAVVKLPINQPEQYELLCVEEKEALQKWIEERIRPNTIKRYSRYLSSYNLKHIFERETGIYVCNGAFKGAMLEANILPRSYGELNWVFKVSQRIENLNK